MYCPKCGTLNEDGAKLCSSCSYELGGQCSSTISPNTQPKTSGAAKAALILGIIAFLTFGLTALPALICGIIALVNISKSRGSLKGNGYAIFGIVTPFIYFFLAIAMAILMPALGKTRELAQRLICGENIKGIGIALMVYANDYDGMLPDGDNWCSLLEQTVDVDHQQFLCPATSEDDCCYSMNINVAGRDFDSLPDDVVLAFESLPGCNQAGGPELLNIDNHREGCNILFCDGQVEFVRLGSLEELLWDIPVTEETQSAQN